MYEWYEHLPSGRKITIIRKRGYGRPTFREEIGELGVFFYRGDSEGEGGSGDMWLAYPWIGEILKKLINGGLLVTDGSNHGKYPPERYRYHELVKYRANPELSGPQEDLGRSFDFKASADSHSAFRFECVGYVGMRNGPTFVWKVTNPRPQQ